jgi:nicotinamidase-related amidase
MKPEALLVIDMQKGFMKSGAETAIPAVKEVVTKWPVQDLYYLKYRNYPGSLFTMHLDWHEFMTSDQVDFEPGIYVEGAEVFDHYGYRPPDELLAKLKKYKTVGICGVDTDACVMAAVFSLWDSEIRPVVLARYCASSGGDQMHRAALDLMLRQFGVHSILRDHIF